MNKLLQLLSIDKKKDQGTEGNNINQVLAQASTKKPSYGATNITYMNHVSLPPYKENKSFVVN